MIDYSISQFHTVAGAAGAFCMWLTLPKWVMEYSQSSWVMVLGKWNILLSFDAHLLGD